MSTTKKKNGYLDLKKLAADCIEKREKETITFRDFQKATGLDKATLHRVETGYAPGIDNLVIICNWLNKTVQSYLTK